MTIEPTTRRRSPTMKRTNFQLSNSVFTAKSYAKYPIMLPKLLLVPHMPIKNPLFPFPNQLPIHATTDGHPVD